jgi:hypothetical protein
MQDKCRKKIEFMRHILFISQILFCILIWKSLPVQAASAVFSQDGNRIYIGGDNLSIIDLAHPDHIDKITSPSLFSREEIDAVTLAHNETILCLSTHHVVAFDPKNHKFSKFYDAAASDTLQDLAYNPKNSLLLVTLMTESENDYGDEPFKAICFKASDPNPIKVISRMVGGIECPIFDSQGNLYFSWHGDLWQGGIELVLNNDRETDKVTTQTLTLGQAEKIEGWLMGDRIAPVARLKTADYAAWNMGVSEIAIADSRIYLAMHAMGHSYGYLLSVARPSPDIKHPDKDLSEKYFGDFIQELSSIKEIPCHGIPSSLCSSPDGLKVFYISNQ